MMTQAKTNDPEAGKKLSFNFAEGEVLNINKPSGWTSFDVVKKIRNLVGVKKVGHAGTLDPFATGVLVICTGKATKRINEFVETSKEYIGEIFFGIETDSYDITGQVVANYDGIKKPSLEKIKDVLTDFKGEIMQVPPMFSALKVKGKRLYHLARQGKTVEREPRKVTVHALDILDYDYPVLKVRVHCSKGTYIRSLAHDIGQRLEVGAHLKSLERTKVGDFSVDRAWNLDDFVKMVGESTEWK